MNSAYIVRKIQEKGKTHSARFAKEANEKNRHSCPKTRMAIDSTTIRERTTVKEVSTVRVATTARGSDSRGSWYPYRD